MYKNRDLEKQIGKNLENELILLVLGARQTGKTTLLKHFFHRQEKDGTASYFTLKNPEFKRLLNEHPDNLFKIINTNPQQKHTVFIDEIQYLDQPSNFLKYIFDEYKEQIKLIVTGSSPFYIDKKFKDSLAGRKKIFHLYSLNFGEFLRFKDETEIFNALKKATPLPRILQKNFELLFDEYITYGAYPRIVLSDQIEEKKDLLENMTFDHIKKDIYEAQIQDEDKYYRLLQILASQCGQLVNANELANTLNLSQPTIEKYLYVMQRSFQIALIKPFYRNIRKELSKMQKVFFYDLGTRNQLLNNFDNIQLRSDRGAITENIFFREALFTHKLNKIKFWRSDKKQEIDFIIDEKQAFELKFQAQDLNPTKYSQFIKRYPEIPLKLVSLNEIKDQLSNI